ncbi:lactonase family protein [Pseudolactococcus paracarnosus]|uniref:Lactonase family protein n=1 Tax=Pseudolactococcus paracarnosus TaxID=2749962 RepID=A0ABT0AIJ2_9LACT|nr:lactonase family protein [Lactococcus paracarnosus]MCJ1976356.1 lactonase family protein [Lactococcus paracarnosus]MCJ1982942.1 lactonase family protein [Lactococcus paracarnosus]MCJ1998414.1 lactonase family protein [Lactococcus paracarnosus]
MTETLYFGTYTKKTSEGIYTADLDTTTGLLTNLQLKIKELNPTYLAFDKIGHIYSVGSENGEGGIAAFTANGNLLNHVVAPGAPLCYVAVDEARQLVYGANYHKGEVSVYQRASDGSLTLTDTDVHVGSGPHENQASPHVHYSDLTPDNFLVTCDLGTDEVVTYDVSTSGKLNKLATYEATPGAGPRHIAFHPTQKIAYLICELNNTIEVLIYDGVGRFELLQVISTLPENWDAFNGTAAIRITSDGKFLYASNRGHDSIAVYEVLADGTLAHVQLITTNGKIPRDFTLSTNEKILVVPHQDSDNVTTFLRDQKTGHLSEVQHDFTVPEAVCVVVK